MAFDDDSIDTKPPNMFLGKSDLRAGSDDQTAAVMESLGLDVQGAGRAI